MTGAVKGNFRRARVLLPARLGGHESRCDRPKPMISRVRPLLAAAVCLLAGGCTTQAVRETGPLRVGMGVDRPGLAVRSGDGYAGLDVDVANYVAARLGRDGIRIVPTPRAQRAMVLTTGQVDLVVSGFSATADRAEQVTFAGAYLVVHQRLMTRVSSAMTLDRVTSRRLCAAYGSTAQDYIVENLPGVHLFVQDSYAACMERLLDRRVDGVLADDVVLTGYADQAAYDSKVVIKSATAATETYAIGLPKGELTLCRQVNEAVADMVATGAWQRSVEAHLAPMGYVVDKAVNPPPQQPCA